MFLYYPPEVSSMKYSCLGVFRKEYFRLVTNYSATTKNRLKYWHSNYKKHLRGSIPATIHPLALILTIWELVSIIA